MKSGGGGSGGGENVLRLCDISLAHVTRTCHCNYAVNCAVLL